MSTGGGYSNGDGTTLKLVSAASVLSLNTSQSDPDNDDLSSGTSTKLSTGGGDDTKTTKKPINLTDLVEDLLIKILSDLDVPELVAIERVSKNFQFMVNKCFQLKKHTLDKKVCLQVTLKGGSIAKIINRFSTGL